jgi:hypothetical protein
MRLSGVDQLDLNSGTIAIANVFAVGRDDGMLDGIVLGIRSELANLQFRRASMRAPLYPNARAITSAAMTSTAVITEMRDPCRCSEPVAPGATASAGIFAPKLPLLDGSSVTFAINRYPRFGTVSI